VGGGGGLGLVPEDVPGVPTTAWLRVMRGTPMMEPFTPGWCGVLLTWCSPSHLEARL
jgi:hypothetical protein